MTTGKCECIYIHINSVYIYPFFFYAYVYAYLYVHMYMFMYITKGSSRGATLSFTLRSKGEGGQPRYLILQEIASHFGTPPCFCFDLIPT